MKDDLPWSFYYRVVGPLRRDLAGVEWQFGITYLVELCGRVKDTFHFLKPLLLGLRRDTERSRINDMAEVFVQGFSNNLHVLLQESPIKFVNELNLRGAVAF